MKILILSCGTGGGHNSACMALKKQMENRGHDVETLNPYMLKGRRTASTIDRAYIAMAQKIPKAFGAVYKLGDSYRRLPVASPVYYLNRYMVPVMEQYIAENHFDAILMTHLFPAEILTNMKRKGKKVPPTCFVMTDYTCIPFTEETDCDYYIIPAEELKDEFISRGLPEDKLYPFGIPVRQQFSQQKDRTLVRQKLGFSPDKKYILVAGGSIGAGQIPQIVSLLLRHYSRNDVEVIVVCGNNRTLYERLSADYGEQCTLLQYTSNMADYMCACDLFLSKPGGLSSTEAAVCGTALIHVTPIPGCETNNMQFFERHGMCLAVTSPKTQLISACDQLMDDNERQKMCGSQKRCILADAAQNICSLVESEYAKRAE